MTDDSAKSTTGTKPPGTSASAASRTRRWRWRVAAKLILTVLVVYLTWQFTSRVGWREVGARLAASSPSWVLVALALLVSRFAAWHHRWQLALVPLGPLAPQLTRFFILLSAVFVNHVTPTGRILGGIFRARYLTRYSRQSFATLYGAVLVDILSNQVVLFIATWLAVVALAWRLGRFGLAGFGTILLALLVAAAAFWVRRRVRHGKPIVGTDWLRRRVSRAGPKLEVLLAGGRETLRSFALLVTDRGLQARMGLWGIVVYAVNIAAQWSILSW